MRLRTQDRQCALSSDYESGSDNAVRKRFRLVAVARQLRIRLLGVRLGEGPRERPAQLLTSAAAGAEVGGRAGPVPSRSLTRRAGRRPRLSMRLLLGDGVRCP